MPMPNPNPGANVPAAGKGKRLSVSLGRSVQPNGPTTSNGSSLNTSSEHAQPRDRATRRSLANTAIPTAPPQERLAQDPGIPSSSLLGPTLRLSAAQGGGSLTALPIVPALSRTASRRNSVTNLVSQPGSMVSIRGLEHALDVGGNSGSRGSVNALPPIGASAPASAPNGDDGSGVDGSRRGRARVLWDLIRTFVSRKFFSTFMTGAAATTGNDFTALMSKIWSQLRTQQFRYQSQSTSTDCYAASGGYDVASWLELDRAPSTATQMSSFQAKKPGDDDADSAFGPEPSDLDLSLGGVSASASDLLHGMSLDKLPSFELAPTLAAIAAGLQPHVAAAVLHAGTHGLSSSMSSSSSSHRSGSADLDASTTPHLLTAWRLLVLALRTADPVHRRLALATLAAVGPAISRTCTDPDTRDVLASALLEVMIADEVPLNRMHAVHVLGEVFGLYLKMGEDEPVVLGSAGDGTGTGTNATPSSRVFFELVSALHAVQVVDRRQVDEFPVPGAQAAGNGGKEAQLAQEIQPKLTAAQRESLAAKVFLFSALGKYLHGELEPVWVKSAILYLVWVELEYVFPLYGGWEEYVGVIDIVMRILTSILPNEANRTFMGAMFKSHIQPLMSSSSNGAKATARAFKSLPLTDTHALALRRLAVQFTALWLPITRDAAYAQAYTVLLDGIKVIPSDDATLRADRNLLHAKLNDESSRAVTRTRVLWQLLQMPGMTSRLQRVPGAPRGWFATPEEIVRPTAASTAAAAIAGGAAKKTPSVAGPGSNKHPSVPTCNMPLTSGIAVYLPDVPGNAKFALHPDTVVYVTRPLPQLPGVPHNATTVPPVFMDPSWAAKLSANPGSPYEVKERHGRLPGLPAGYSYSPAPVPPLTVTEIPAGKSLVPPRPPADTGRGLRIGVVTTELPPPRKVPFGFVTRPCNVDVASLGPDGAAVATMQPSILPETSLHIRRPSMGVSVSRMALNVRGDQDEMAEAVLEQRASSSFSGGTSLGGAGGHDDLASDMSLGSLARIDDQGYTFEKIPAVFSVAPGTLVNEPPTTEFLLNAPVVLDIVEPTRARRITARIVSINKYFEPVAVNNGGYLSPGARFNLHIRPKKRGRTAGKKGTRRVSIGSGSRESLNGSRGSTPGLATTENGSKETIVSSMGDGLDASTDGEEEDARWITVQLQVEEDHTPPVEVLRNVNSSLMAPTVIACGYTADGSPYLAPPANTSPMPLGYTKSGDPYYGMPPVLRPIPAGCLGDGRIYFHAGSAATAGWDSTAQFQHGLAGFDYNGRPFFVPKGCKVPSPTGYTSYGIPYYDLSTILLERGELLETSTCSPDAHLSWTTALNLIRTQQTPSWMVDGTDTGAEVLPWYPDPTHRFTEPKGIQFIRELEDLAYLHPPGIKTVLEPSSLHFQSVSETVTRPCILKFRALRGDHSERDYFLTVEPMDIFAIDTFHVRLQGEGMVQFKVSCHSSRIRFQSVEGTLALIDETGRRLVTCKLTASRKSFVRVYPLQVHCGWVMPNQSTAFVITCENITSQMIQLGMKKPTNGFSMPEEVIKLQGKESKAITVKFEPQVVGAYESTIQVEAPGGEMITVHIAGVCGVPLALHTESLQDSALGPDVLARERSTFVSRVFKLLSNGESVLSVAEKHMHTPDEHLLFSSLLFAMDPVGRRSNQVCIDFGLIDVAKPSSGGRPVPTGSLCLTLFNVSTETLTCSLHTTSAELELDTLVRVTPHKANAVRVSIRPKALGHFCAMITLTCPGFASIPCLVRAFVGCPLVLACLPSVWMAPVEPGQTASITLPIINQCNVEVKADIEVTSSSDRFRVAGVDMRPSGRVPFPNPNPIKASSESQRSVATSITMGPLSVTSFTLECLGISNNLELASVQLYVDSSLFTAPVVLVAMPLWTGLVKQDFESIAYWLQQSAQLAPFPPVTAPPPLINTENREVLPDSLAPTLRMSVRKMTSSQVVNLQNVAPSALQFNLVVSPGFSLVKQTSNVVRVNANESLHMQVAFRSDFLVENHGFLVAYPDGARGLSIPLIACPLLSVCPLPSLATREVVVDFGTIESGTPRTQEWCIRSLALANTRDTNVMWTCRLITNRNRHCPFEVLVSAGDLKPMQCDLIKFDVSPTVQGVFDATCELMAKEHVMSPPVVVCVILLRVHVVLTQVLGLPDTYDFGSCVVGSEQAFSFDLENVGNCDVHVAFIPRAPFDVSPTTFVMSTGGRQSVEIIYSPTESSKDSVNRIACFINHKVATLRVLGKSGFVELASNNHHNLLDFGSVSSTCIAWMTIFLTNRGTLPLRLENVVASRPEILAVELTGKQLMVRSSTVSVRKDGWSILKSKIKAFALIGHFLRHKLKTVLMNAASGDGQPPLERGGRGGRGSVQGRASPSNLTALANTSVHRKLRLPVASSTGVSLVDVVGYESELILEPMHSYSLRIGFSTVHQTRQTTDLSFYYIPVISNQQAAVPKVVTFSVMGYIYRVLDFSPHLMDFGLVPVSMSSTSLHRVLASAPMPESDSGGDEMDNGRNGSNTRVLRISNMSLETQSVSLLLATSNGMRSLSDSQAANSLTVLNSSGNTTLLSPGSGSHPISVPNMGGSSLSAFRFDGRSWVLGPGESVWVPVRFLPAKPQTQYRGEALLQHSHGVSIIRFSGTGASAEVVYPSRMSFGAVSMNQEGKAKFTLRNKGLLATVVNCQMLDTDIFFFNSNDPYDTEVDMEAGSSMDIDIFCLCKQQIPSINALMRVSWRRSPHEAPESSDVLLTVDVGYPMFSVDELEMDFGVTYTKNVQELHIRNDGNAPCEWRLLPNAFLQYAPSEGNLPPQSVDTITITFQPTTYEPLEADIEFVTEAGTKVVLAYGIVGVPYLNIPRDYLLYDFGIVEINRDHTIEIPFINSGNKQIEFEIQVSMPPGHEDESCVFSVSPVHGYIDAGTTTNVQVTAHPTTFARVTSCEWVVRTTDGERYDGGFSCVGGQAIVKLTKLFGTSTPSRPGTGDINADAKLAAEDRMQAERAVLERFIPQAALVLQDHVRVLKEISMNLSSEDAQELEADMRAQDELRQARSRSTIIGSPNSDSSGAPRPITGPGGRMLLPASPGTGGARPGTPKAPAKIRTQFTMDDSGSPLPPIGTPGIVGKAPTSPASDRPVTTTSSASRPSTQSSAKMRWLEGKLFNLHDVQKPVDELFAKSEDVLRRLQAQVQKRLSNKSRLGGLGESAGSMGSNQGMVGSRAGLSGQDALASSSYGLTSTDELSGSGDPSRQVKRAQRVEPTYFKPVTPGEVQRLVEEAKRTMEMLQMHIPHVTGSKHIHLLEEAVQGILRSSRQIEEVLYASEAHADGRDETAVGSQQALQSSTSSSSSGSSAPHKVAKVFDLGLLKSGDVVDDFTMFDLPNLGNLPFTFTVSISPISMRPYFGVAPKSDTIQPGSSIPMVLEFKAMDEGDYYAELEISGHGQVAAVIGVKAKVGVPKIEVQESELEYGLVLRGTSATRSLKIRNVGSYRDTVELMLESPVFHLDWSIRNPVLVPGAEVEIPVVFTPKSTDQYRAKWTIFPLSGLPVTVQLAGSGVAPELKLFPSKLNFGSIFVGTSKSLPLQLTNAGEWVANILPRLTNSAFALVLDEKTLLPGDSIVVEPKSTRELEVVFSCTDKTSASCNMALEETVTNERSTVQLSGFAGEFMADVDGDVTFGNIKVEDLASNDIVVSNKGDFSFLLHAVMEPEEHRDIFTVTAGTRSVLGASSAITLSQNATETVSLSVCPRTVGMVQGRIKLVATCKSDTSVQEKVFEYPFDFFAFSDPVAIDNRNAEVDIGVLPVGKQSDWTFQATNFDNMPVTVRVRMEIIAPPKAAAVAVVVAETEGGKGAGGGGKGGKDGKKAAGAGKKKRATSASKSGSDANAGKTGGTEAPATCWKLVVPELKLAKGETGTLRAAYEASEDPSRIHEVVLWVEYVREGDQSTEFHSLHRYLLKGKSGRPKVELDTQQLDFGFVPCGTPVVREFKIFNSGTASCEWALTSGWNNDDIFTVVAGCPKAGTLQPGEAASIAVQFNTSVTFEFTSEMEFVLDPEGPEKLKLGIHGQGCVYRIYSPSLPKDVVLNGVFHGDELVRFPFMVANDCVFAVPLEFSVQCPDQPDLGHMLVVSPPNITLLGNLVADASPSDRQTLGAELVLSPARPDTIEQVADLLKMGIQFLVTVRSETLTDVYTIPVRVMFTIASVECSQPKVEFGNIAFDLSKTMDPPLVLQNFNSFAIPFTVASSHELVQPSTSSIIVPAFGTSELTLTMVPKQYASPQDIPTNYPIVSTLTLACDKLGQFLSIPVTGAFVDVIEPPTFEPIDFGPVYTYSTKGTTLKFQNWSRRPLEYQIMVNSDVFAAAGLSIPAVLRDKQLVPGRGTVEVPIAFSPTKAAQLDVPMTLVTSLGGFNLTILGRGISPSISADTAQIDFGKVGAGMPESREITLKNTAELPVEVHLKVEAADGDANIAAQFHVPPTLFLNPNESAKVPIEFHPGDGTSDTDADAQVVVSVPLGQTSEGTRVTSVGVRASTGKFQVVVRGQSRDLAFAKVEAMEMSTLSVEFENTGEVVAVLALAEDEVGVVAAKPGKELVGKENVASFGCKPISQTIEPGAVGKFSLTATGMREGVDTRSLVFFTPNLMRPILFSFNASVTVSAARDVRGLQSFAKSDSSVDEKLQIEVIEKPKFKSDEGLWSVLLPVVKVEAITASDSHYSFPVVPPQEPLLHYASIVHHLTRPAALPTALFPPGSASKAGGGTAAAAAGGKLKAAGFRSKTLGVNRAPMPMAQTRPGVDPAARDVPAVMSKMQMQREALVTLAPLERRLFNGGGAMNTAGGAGGKAVLGSKKYR